AYAVDQNADAVKLPMLPMVGDAKSNDIKDQRHASATGVILNLTSEIAARLTTGALPPTVVPLSVLPAADATTANPSVVIGMVTVELLEHDAAGCRPAREILELSPFRSREKARVQKAVDSQRARLIELAAQMPFVIIDVGFVTHHGSR